MLVYDAHRHDSLSPNIILLSYRSFWPQLLSTADEVEKLQEELETMQPLLAQAAEETVETMEKIKVDSVGTERTLLLYLVVINLGIRIHETAS